MNRLTFLRTLLLAPFAAKGIAATLTAKPDRPHRIIANVCGPAVYIYSSDYRHDLRQTDAIPNAPLRGHNPQQAVWDEYFHLRDNGLL